MGNTPSFEAPQKATQKLSKARVGSHVHTAAGLLSPNGLVSAHVSTTGLSSPRFSDQLQWLYSPTASAPSPVIGQVEGALSGLGGQFDYDDVPPPVPLKDSKHLLGKRRSIFRSRSSQDDRARRERRKTTPGLSAPSMADRLVRTNSTYETGVSHYYTGQTLDSGWNTRSNRTSVNYDLNSYEAKRLLNLVEDSNAPERFERNSMVSESKFEVAPSTWKSSNPHEPSSTNLSRANSDLSLYVPVRRRSIVQTPGVATRSTMALPTLKNKSSKSSFRHSHTGTPSHSRHNSMESNSMRVLSMPPRLVDPEAERAVTPCESQYKQLGVMKFGSLRITNGAASPAPSRDSDRSRTKTASDKASATSGRDDYFLEAQRSSFGSDVSKKEKILGRVTEIKQPKPLSRLLSPLTTTFLKLEGVSLRSSSLNKTSPRPPSPAREVAKGDFLPEIQLSPFSLTDSKPPTPELQTTSKHTAVEDNLFEDDVQNEVSSLDILDFRDDSFAKRRLDRPKPVPSQKSNRSAGKTDSGFVSSPTSEYSNKPLSKADSGYSSNVSLRSFQSSKPPVPEKDFPSRAPVEKATQTQERSDSRSSWSDSRSPYFGDYTLPSPTLIKIGDMALPAPTQGKTRVPPLPPKDPSLASPTKPTHSAPVALQHAALLASNKKTKHVPAPIDSLKTVDAAFASPEGQLSPAGSDSSNSALSIGSGSQRPGKLQRLLSGNGMRGPPSVHATHPTTDKVIPSIPNAVEERLHDHAGRFPMTTKRLAIRNEPSKETLKTIFSVGSVDVGYIDDSHRASRNLDDLVAGVSEHKVQRRRSFVESVPGAIMQMAAAVIPHRKPVPSRSKETEKKNQSVERETFEDEMDTDLEARVTSLDNIRNSMGNSAFDQAFAAMAEERDEYFSQPQMQPTRTLTMNAQLERDMEMRHANRSQPQVASPRRSESLTPSPLPEALTPDSASVKTAKTSKTPPPPASIRTRSIRNLRVPPPLRPQSDPMGHSQSVSRKTSRESIQSYPQASPSVRDESEQAPPVPPMNPRRSLYQNHQLPQLIVPDKQDSIRRPKSTSSDKPQRNPSLGRDGLASPNFQRPTSASPYEQQLRSMPPLRKSSGSSRRSSISSQSSDPASPRFQRPSSASPYEQQLRSMPPLRHRSSYDGASLRHNPNYVQPGKTHRDMSDPWMAAQYQIRQMQQYSGGWEQSMRYPPYVPRSNHYRNRSLNGNGTGQSSNPNNPPYRVLHSYNSPAYRNVPIWG